MDKKSHFAQISVGCYAITLPPQTPTEVVRYPEISGAQRRSAGKDCEGASLKQRRGTLTFRKARPRLENSIVDIVTQ